MDGSNSIRATDTEDVREAVAAVQSTWATLALDRSTTRWIAEDKELNMNWVELEGGGVFLDANIFIHPPVERNRSGIAGNPRKH